MEKLNNVIQMQSDFRKSLLIQQNLTISHYMRRIHTFPDRFGSAQGKSHVRSAVYKCNHYNSHKAAHQHKARYE